MAKRQVFFSFHYANDNWRVAQIRNMGIVEGQDLFSDNSWEKVRLQSDAAIKAWIDRQLSMRSCVVVLIGSETASRKWVQYEIEEGWKRGKGIVGIYIHKLKDWDGCQSDKGKNPFADFFIDRTINFISHRSTPIDSNEIGMQYVCKAYDSDYYSSEYVYDDIKKHIQDWIEEAIEIRNRYSR